MVLIGLAAAAGPPAYDQRAPALLYVEGPADADFARVRVEGEVRRLPVRASAGLLRFELPLDDVAGLESVCFPERGGDRCAAEATVEVPLCTVGPVPFPETGRWAVLPAADRAVEAMATCLRAARAGRAVLVGHADVRGPSVYNRDLSLLRAAAVADALRARGVDATFELVAAGEQLAGDPAWSADRRVVLAAVDARSFPLDTCAPMALSFAPGSLDPQAPPAGWSCHRERGATGAMVWATGDDAGEEMPAPGGKTPAEVARGAYGASWYDAVVAARALEESGRAIGPDDPLPAHLAQVPVSPVADTRREAALAQGRERAARVLATLGTPPPGDPVGTLGNGADGADGAVLPLYNGPGRWRVPLAQPKPPEPPEPPPELPVLEPAPVAQRTPSAVTVLAGAGWFATQGEGTFGYRGWLEGRWQHASLVVGAGAWSNLSTHVVGGAYVGVAARSACPQAVVVGAGVGDGPTAARPWLLAGGDLCVLAPRRSPISLAASVRSGLALDPARPVYAGLGFSLLYRPWRSTPRPEPT